MGNKKFIITFIIMCLLVFMIFITYFMSNIIPVKTKNNFNIEQNSKFIKDYRIENNTNRTTIYLDTNSDIFKEYNYHSYISGDGVGKKILLEMFLISEDNSLCYKIKANCYDYEDVNNLKFVGFFYNAFIKKNTKYNVAIYIPDTDAFYVTDINISN